MEPYYYRFEYLRGICGKAGNLNGKKVAGGNVFEDERARDYPNPPMKEPYGSAMVMKMRARIGEDGGIVDWRHDVWSHPHSTRPTAGDIGRGR